jgi:hypothetical protein
MSKSSKAVVVTVSVEQFNDALVAVVQSGNDAKAALTTIAGFIAQATNKTEQDKLKKQLAQAWIKHQEAVEGKTIKLDSATKWVQRRVKQLAPKGFKWLVSKTANATKKRAARQATKAAADAPAPAKTPAKPQSTIEQLRNALIAKETQIADEFRGVIPSGKIKEFDQAFAAFIETINIILK